MTIDKDGGRGLRVGDVWYRREPGIFEAVVRVVAVHAHMTAIDALPVNGSWSSEAPPDTWTRIELHHSTGETAVPAEPYDTLLYRIKAP